MAVTVMSPKNRTKQRWPLVIVVLATPVMVAGIDVWLTDFRSPAMQYGPHYSQTARPKPPLRPVRDDEGDLDEELRRLREWVAERRGAAVPDPESLGQALLELGKLEQFAGRSTVAAAFREVTTLPGGAERWQAREAISRLADLDKLAASPDDTRRWREAAGLDREARAMHAAGRFREAIGLAEKSLDLRRQLWGSDHRETAESLLLLGWLSTEHADFYLRAEGLTREAADRLRKAVGEKHPASGDCLYVLATLADDKGDFSGADRLYEQARAVYRDSLGELSREYARALNRQGRMHNVWWKDYSAGKNFQALEIRERILDKEHPDCAESREDTAEVAYALLHYENAEAQLETAIDIRRRRQGELHPDLARPLGILAACQAEQGKISKALINIRRALTLTEQSRGARHPSMAERQILLGKISIRSNDYSVGNLALSKARETLSGLGLQKHPRFCEVIFQQADSLRHDGLNKLDENSTPSMVAARLQMEEAVAVYRTLPNVEKIGYFAEALLNLANIYFYLNYPDETREAARQLIAEAEQVVKHNGGKAHPLYSCVPLSQGHYCAARGHYDLALPFHQDAVDRIRQQVGTAAPWLLGRNVQALIGTRVHQGIDLRQAREHCIDIFHLYNDIYQKNAAGECDSSRVAAMEDCFLLLSMNLSVGEALHDLSSLYDMVLAVRGAATCFQTSHRLAHDHSEMQPLLKKIDRERQALKERVFSDDPRESKQAWAESALAASERKEFAECELAIAIRPLVPEEAPVTWQQIQSALPDDTAFVDFVQYVHFSAPEGHQGRLDRHRRILAYILKKSGAPVCISLGSSSEIEKAVTAWQQAIIDYLRDGTSGIDQEAHELARLIWTPLASVLSNVGQLYIAPDGPLCFVSFAAMPGREPGTYALEDFLISHVNSGRWLYQQLQKEGSPPGEGLLLCGNIEYRQAELPAIPALDHARNRKPLLPDLRKLDNLPATIVEMEQVGKLFADAYPGKLQPRELSGRYVTAAALKSSLVDNWRYIHFAGHGFFIDPENAQALTGHIETFGQSAYFVQRNQSLLSGLVLAAVAGANASSSILIAEEVGNLDLRGTDLVVLSACDTDLGCTRGADGVIGLTRAFLTAGSRSVVSSLWKVDDAATSLLMEEFYRNLWERHQPKREALRNAQKAVLNAPGRITERSQYLALREVKPGQTRLLPQAPADNKISRRSHPALWAAFVLNGDGR